MRASLLLSFLLASSTLGGVLVPRGDDASTCADLTANSNNGDRKVAIVIDSSGSMSTSDPTDLRLGAGRSVNDWLITKREEGKKKADLVTVIDFSTTATLDYPLGDPAGANGSFDSIGAIGGTFIAGGVKMAISELTKSGSGQTGKRSGILVFTDGEVRESHLLSGPISNAAQRIRTPRPSSKKSTEQAHWASECHLDSSTLPRVCKTRTCSEQSHDPAASIPQSLVPPARIVSSTSP
jgi:hypothetical protein